ncbi:response regulator [Candidatus Uhrbacteria bacterium]|nr:response regulator [Candidatus Uhrbacteria bacterium]
MGYTESVASRLEELKDNEENLDALERIQDNARRIVKLVTGFVDASKAEAGKIEVEMVSSELPDLIVMDIRMPQMDGLQAASRIRTNPKTQAIPILAATAKALPGDREKCLASGCGGYIAKPFTHKELEAAIKRLLKEQSE